MFVVWRSMGSETWTIGETEKLMKKYFLYLRHAGVTGGFT